MQNLYGKCNWFFSILYSFLFSGVKFRKVKVGLDSFFFFGKLYLGVGRKKYIFAPLARKLQGYKKTGEYMKKVKENKKGCHPRVFLPGISLIGYTNKRKAGDSRTLRAAKPSGRTASFGFTLIELLVVVLIIGILAAVALPQYQQSVLKSRFVQLKTMATALAHAQEVYYLANGEYSHSYNDLDIDTPAYQEETPNTSQGIDRPRRTFSWGSCTLWEEGSVSCLTGDVVIMIYSKQSNTSYAGKSVCLARNASISSIENKLCKNETGLAAPTESTDTNMRWVYP